MQAKLGINYRKTICRGTYDANLHLDWLSSVEAVIEAGDGVEACVDAGEAIGTIKQTAGSFISNLDSHTAIQGSCDPGCLGAYVGAVNTSCVGAEAEAGAGAR